MWSQMRANLVWEVVLSTWACKTSVVPCYFLLSTCGEREMNLAPECRLNVPRTSTFISQLAAFDLLLVEVVSWSCMYKVNAYRCNNQPYACTKWLSVFHFCFILLFLVALKACGWEDLACTRNFLYFFHGALTMEFHIETFLYLPPCYWSRAALCMA